MPNDQPIGYTADGRPLYDNTPTVVCLVVQNRAGHILAVRRANDPGKGLLGLPGGYHMRGETWQEAGLRELEEETGIRVFLKPEHIENVLGIVTDEYGNNLIVAALPVPIDAVGKPQDGEALEVLWVDPTNMNRDDWAFPRHFNAVCHYHVHHSIRDWDGDED